jgi:cytochrome c biogenesis protein CcmG/thiol:disulfide interchange protein DsbE
MSIRVTRGATRLLLLLVAPALLGASSLPKVGEPAPATTITLVDGTKLTLADLRGKVVVLNFWATWCVPCRTELPLLDRYYELQRRAGLRVFAVTTEGSLPLFQMKKLFAAMHIPAARKITGRYADVKAVPTNYVIDRSGRIRYAKAGAFELDEMNAILVPLLREPAPEGTSPTA